MSKLVKITVAGLAGTGTSTLGKAVQEGLCLRGRKPSAAGLFFMSGGDFFREEARKRGLSMRELEELTKMDPSVDRVLDQRTKEFGEKNDHFVVEARLGWYFIPDSFKILLVCEDEVRLARIALREGKGVDVVRDETMHREESIRLRYKSLYNIDDCADPGKFDLVVRTDIFNKDETFFFVRDTLLRVFPQLEARGL